MKALNADSLNNSWQAWAGAVVLTLVLNLALFTGIPYLVKPKDWVPQLGPVPAQIQLTRLRRPLVEPEKRNDPEPEKKVNQEKPPDPTLMNRPALKQLSLPFEVNPKLVNTPAVIALPDVKSSSLDHLNLAVVFNPGELDCPLSAISKIPPVYPVQARVRGITGWVMVAFIVTEQGRVEDIKILEAEPETIFDQSVIQCLSAWRFKPGSIKGEPVRTRVRTKIRFDLK